LASDAGECPSPTDSVFRTAFAAGCAGEPLLLRFRFPRLDREDPGWRSASDTPPSDGMMPDSGSFTTIFHCAAHALFSQKDRSRRLFDFDVGANVPACHEFAKFFFIARPAHGIDERCAFFEKGPLQKHVFLFISRHTVGP
jgi:hypothetical protein